MDDSFLSCLLSNTLCMKSETASRGAVKNLRWTYPCYPPPSCSQVISHLMWCVRSLFWVRNIRYCAENWMFASFCSSPPVIWICNIFVSVTAHLLSDPPEWAYSAFLLAAPNTATATGCPDGCRLSVHQNCHTVVAAAIMKILCFPSLWLKAETLCSRYVVFFPECWRLT